MISRDASLQIAAALRRQHEPAMRHYNTLTVWLDIRAEIGAILMQECAGFDRMQYHLLTEIKDHVNVGR